MKEIHRNKEQTWYLVEEFTTKSSLLARVQKCVWSDEVKGILGKNSMLKDFFTGYVKVPEGVLFSEKEMQSFDVHGGVTFPQKNLVGIEGSWIGFDMAHVGDENISGPEAYVKAECEKLAEQIAKKK